MLISKESLAERLGPVESSAVRKERVRTEAMRGTLRDGGVNPDLIDAAVAASGFVVEEVAIGFHSAWNMMATLVADLDAFVETTELSEELADLSLI